MSEPIVLESLPTVIAEQAAQIHTLTAENEKLRSQHTRQAAAVLSRQTSWREMRDQLDALVPALRTLRAAFTTHDRAEHDLDGRLADRVFDAARALLLALPDDGTPQRVGEETHDDGKNDARIGKGR